MQELDESFQATVKRAVAPFKEDTTREKPNMDVSFRPHSEDMSVGQADMARTKIAPSEPASSVSGSFQTPRWPLPSLRSTVSTRLARWSRTACLTATT